MKTPIVLASALAGIVLAATACGTSGSIYGSSTGSPSPAPTAAGSPSPAPTAAGSPSPAPVATGTAVDVGQTRLGQVLVDQAGRTLYLFVADTGSSSTCYGQCATYWPPLTTTGMPIVGTGANQALLGTSKRTDGTTMVTYNGHPLYYFISDKQAGDVKGQGINGFGGPWYVLGANGNAITR